ncbi:MAG: radical SAM protein [Terracidiphilus sp.]|jgi:nitrogen fixation protein NifB
MLKILQPGQNGGDQQVCTAQQMRMSAAKTITHLDGKHPCFSSTVEGHKKAGRLHLPVSPACNIECRFCRRDFNSTEQRPGVARQLISPEKAPDVVERALKLCPEINVVGIAGPGDTLATDHALRAFENVHRRFPHLIKCLSTNGLLLEEKADQIADAGVETITVTVNAVDSAVLAQLCAGIRYRGKRIVGTAASELLISKQIAGIRRIVQLGVTVKANTVLVPGINDSHIEEVASTVAAAGASVINVIPLLPQHELSHIPRPDFIQISRARRDAEMHLGVFAHCNRCRADACGIPGETDFSIALYGRPVAASTFSHG